MKIIHVSPAYVLVLAGEELHMKVLSDGLASHGHDVTVLTVNAWRRQISFAVSAMGAGASLARFGRAWNSVGPMGAGVCGRFAVGLSEARARAYQQLMARVRVSFLANDHNPRRPACRHALPSDGVSCDRHWSEWRM